MQVLQLEVGRAEFVPSYKSRCFFYDMMLARPTVSFVLYREKVNKQKWDMRDTEQFFVGIDFCLQPTSKLA